jgi:hypothetical protein
VHFYIFSLRKPYDIFNTRARCTLFPTRLAPTPPFSTPPAAHPAPLSRRQTGSDHQTASTAPSGFCAWRAPLCAATSRVWPRRRGAGFCRFCLWPGQRRPGCLCGRARSKRSACSARSRAFCRARAGVEFSETGARSRMEGASMAVV